MNFAVYVCNNNHEFAVKENEDPIACPICGQVEFEFSHSIEDKPKELKLPSQKISLSIFRESDQERASKEIDCYGYLMVKAMGYMAKTEFSKAAAYHENIARSLKELQRLKTEKEFYDKVKTILKEIQEKRQSAATDYHLKNISRL